MTSKRKYDIIVFGATGACGRYMVMEIAKLLESSPADQQFTWAVAGRSMSKMNSILQDVSTSMRKDLSYVDKILADVSNPHSLREMAGQGEVILNFVGPYLLYGEAVVKACIAEGTHHLDLAAEDLFMEEMQLKYNTAAEASGSFIVASAGMSALLSDYGAVYLEQNFSGELNSVESCINAFNGTKPPEAHVGTYSSILIMLHRFSELESVKRQLYPDPYFQFQHKLSIRPLGYNTDVKSWCISLPFPDIRVMERTQRYKFHELRQRPAQTGVYIQLPYWWLAVILYVALKVVIFLTRFEVIVNVLQKYPRLFSLGQISPEGKIKEEVDHPFTFTLIGKGWEKTSGEPVGPPNKKLIVKVRGKYGSVQGTCIVLLAAGVTIIKERQKMPIKGGVYTPGIAFAGTNLADRLTSQGITFTIDKCMETWVDMGSIV